ncbi:hemolysin family protein [Paludisphaera sp.]|uniref:hemolysin family protein n=1 Tax=Paludisphaera sp. TaxID=2017432 RepID=UPI00301D132B
MTSIVMLALEVLALLAIAGLCSLLPHALEKAEAGRLRERAARGEPGARGALELVRRPEGAKAAARIAATAAVVMAGVVAGTAVGVDDGSLARLPAAGAAVAVAAAAAVLAEAVPRALAAGRPEWYAARLSRTLGAAARLAAPAAVSLQRLGSALARRLGARPPEKVAGVEHKVRELMREGVEAGAFDATKHAIFLRSFRFCERRARALMTPRDRVVWLDVHDSPEEIARKVALSPHASLPVCDETLDNLLGMVRMKDLFARGADGQPARFRGLLVLPDFIYEAARGPQVLEVLQRSPAGAAVVLDEFGSVVGVVSLDDVRDSLLGATAEKPDEADAPRAVQRPDGSWLLDGRFPVDELVDLFQIPDPPPGEFDTLGGLVVTRLGRIPSVGEGFDDLGLHFEVVDMDANRVDHVLIRPLPIPS